MTGSVVCCLPKCFRPGHLPVQWGAGYRLGLVIGICLSVAWPANFSYLGKMMPKMSRLGLGCIKSGQGLRLHLLPDSFVSASASATSTHACDLCACFWLPSAGHLSKGERTKQANKGVSEQLSSAQHTKVYCGKDTGWWRQTSRFFS